MLMTIIVRVVVDVSATNETSDLQACHGYREETEAAAQQGKSCEVLQGTHSQVYDYYSQIM